MTPEKASPAEDGAAATDVSGALAPVVEHLQAATLELIAAGRAFLDLLERVMDDPVQLVNAVTGMRPPEDQRAKSRPIERIDVQDGRSANGG